MTQIGLLQSQLGNEIRIVLQEIQKNGQLPYIHASISVTQTFHTIITPPGSHACSPPCLWFLSQIPSIPTISQAHLLLPVVHEESELIIQKFRGVWDLLDWSWEENKMPSPENWLCVCVCVCVCVCERERERAYKLLQWNMTRFTL